MSLIIIAPTSRRVVFAVVQSSKNGQSRYGLHPLQTERNIFEGTERDVIVALVAGSNRSFAFHGTFLPNNRFNASISSVFSLTLASDRPTSAAATIIPTTTTTGHCGPRNAFAFVICSQRLPCIRFQQQCRSPLKLPRRRSVGRSVGVPYVRFASGPERTFERRSQNRDRHRNFDQRIRETESPESLWNFVFESKLRFVHFLWVYQL